MRLQNRLRENECELERIFQRGVVWVLIWGFVNLGLPESISAQPSSSGRVTGSSVAVLSGQADDSSRIAVYRLTNSYNQDGPCSLATSAPERLVAVCIVKIYRSPSLLEQLQANAARMKGIPVGAGPVDTGETKADVLEIPYAAVLGIERGPKSWRFMIPKEYRGKPWVSLMHTNDKGKKAKTVFICGSSSDADQLVSVVTKRTGRTAVTKGKLR